MRGGISTRGYDRVGRHRIPMIYLFIYDAPKHYIHLIFILERPILKFPDARYVLNN